MLTQPELITLIENVSKITGLDSKLALAIAYHETDLNPLRTRFEPSWSYFYLPEDFATKLEITAQTEKILQAISWGCMQVMGSVARELGYEGYLNYLSDPQSGILYGCKKIKKLSKIYVNEKDVISAYNQGSPRRDGNGKYLNQVYVDDVMSKLNDLRA